MKKSQKIEKRVYELLGVNLFRKAAFKLEKIVHRKDKGKNTNYHIQKNEVDSLGEFKKYLYYNGTIHTSNLIKGIPILALMFIFNFKILSIITLSAWLLKDAYCVMLQRYNWIKLSEKEELLKTKKTKKVLSNYSQYNEELLNELINFSYNYQDNGMQEERVIDKYNSNEMQDNNFEIQKKSDAKVKKLVR